jgi:MinD-like ATPase involved in chromosome partitioning or flagellar assembly
MSDGRIIGLVSGKGGVGKTSLAVNLCIGLKQQGA